MADILNSPTGQLVVMLAICAALGAVGIYLVAHFRNAAREQGPTSSDLMTNFRELYSRGELSDEEYRTIKTKLASRLQNETNDSSSSG
jgi:uncharacterized membrane protein